MDHWRQALVMPQAALTELLVAGMAQWLSLVTHRWHRKSLLCASWITLQSHENWQHEHWIY